MSQLISLKNLNLSFGEKIIFDNAELAINKGDKIGLIGLNGQGKSTLFNILTRSIHPDISTPAFMYDQSNESFDIFLIPQELNIKDYSDLSIENYYLAFYPELYSLHREIESGNTDADVFEKFEALGGWDIQNNYINYLKGFDLNDHERSVENLSGGEKRKMALSIGLSSKAEFLLWDEPTNHLDIATIERFEEELINSKKTYMIISHDRYLLNHSVDKIFHIERGKITSFKGTYLDYLEYLEQREAELMKNLDKLENKQRRELAWMRQGIKARRTRSKKRVEGFHHINDAISDIKSRSKKTVDLGLLHSGRKSKVLVQIEEGEFYYDETLILKNLNILLTKKDKIALIGPNGAGKSTLIKILAERLALSSGKQKNADGLKVVIFDQNRESLDLEKTPLEIIGEGNDFVILGDGSRKHVTSYLKNFLFSSDQVNRPVATLSGGEKNRLQLAMFMKQSTDLWVFDEPTNDLDIETIELLEKELKAYDAAIIIIGHDRAFLDNTCNSTWLIHNHELEMFEGGYTQVAPYLHALELEKELLKQGKQKNIKLKTDPENISTQKIQKMNFKEKERFKVIETEISDMETAVELAKEKLANFDFTAMNSSKNKAFDELSQDKLELESKLEKLYEEWEELSAKTE